MRGARARPKPSLFRPIPHAGDGCDCDRCVEAREENAIVRASMNWSHRRPPRSVAPLRLVPTTTPDEHRCPGLKADFPTRRTA